MTAALCRGGLSVDLRQTGSLHCFFFRFFFSGKTELHESRRLLGMILC